MDIEPSNVIKIVKSGSQADALLNHERRERVTNTSGCYYYMGKSLRGGLPSLKSVYWPKSNIYKQMKIGKAANREPHSKGKKRKRSDLKKGKGKGGIIRGTHVHQQLKDFSVLDKKNFKKIHGELHPFSYRLMRAIVDQMKWQPFLSEFDIGDEDLGVGTSVDMIGLDIYGRLILLEFKTGYRGYFDAPDGKMRASMSALGNSAKNQACLQLTLSSMILQKKYNVPLEAQRLYVMRVDDESMDIMPIQNEFVKKFGPLIYNDLFNATHDVNVPSS